jgi:hypothetical protein
MSKCVPRAVALFFVVSLAVVSRGTCAEAPQVWWSAEPVLPGEFTFIQGDGWDDTLVVAIDSDETGKTRIVPNSSIENNARSLRFLLPKEQLPGVTCCAITTRGGTLRLTLNLPQPWWSQGDQGRSGTPGGWVRIFGRCLAFEGSEPRVQLRNGVERVDAIVTNSCMWSLTARIPQDTRNGPCDVWVHNGTGADDAWSHAGQLRIGENTPSWPESALWLSDYGAAPDDDSDDSIAFRKALEALDKRGGGILAIPRGRFCLTGAFVIPQKVLIKGAGMEFTHLVWKDTDVPPDAFFSNTTGRFGLEDLSLFANNYRKGLHASLPKGSPRTALPIEDIQIRRVRVRFAPLSVAKLSSSQESIRRKEMQKSAVFEIIANNVKLIQCDLAWSQGIGFSLHGCDVVCRGNVLKADGGWCPVGGGTRIICERNDFSGVTTGVARGGQVWFAHNTVSHQYVGFREGFTTDGIFGGVGFLKNAKINGREVTFTADASRAEAAQIPAAIRVIDGKGAGQYRRIITFGDKLLEMEREFDVQPDESSVLWAANALSNQICFDNYFSDNGIGVQLYGAALDCVVAKNTSERSGGFRAWGNEMCWYVQFLDNRIAEGYGLAGPESAGGFSSINAIGPYVRGFQGVTCRGVVMRRNLINNNAAIVLRGAIHDVLVENNEVKHSSRGIVGDLIARQQGVLLQGNTFEDVDLPLEPANAAEHYRILDGEPKR